jgi:hypothetical protein
VSLIEIKHPVEALSATAPDPSLGVPVRHWGPDRSQDNSRVFRLEYSIGFGRELLVPVVEHNAQPDALFLELPAEMAGLLAHPGSGRLSSAARRRDSARRQMHIYKDVEPLEERLCRR